MSLSSSRVCLGLFEDCIDHFWWKGGTLLFSSTWVVGVPCARRDGLPVTNIAIAFASWLGHISRGSRRGNGRQGGVDSVAMSGLDGA